MEGQRTIPTASATVTLSSVWRFPIIKDVLPVLFPSLRAYAGDVANARYI